MQLTRPSLVLHDFRGLSAVFGCAWKSWGSRRSFRWLHLRNQGSASHLAGLHLHSRDLRHLKVFAEVPHAGCLLVEEPEGHEGEFPLKQLKWIKKMLKDSLKDSRLPPPILLLLLQHLLPLLPPHKPQQQQRAFKVIRSSWHKVPHSSTMKEYSLSHVLSKPFSLQNTPKPRENEMK